jgi:hypothetical protein
MIIPVTRSEWIVLDNAAHARRYTYGFHTAPINLNATIIKLQRLGLIEQGHGMLYQLTTKGRMAHQYSARKYSALK